MAALGGTFRRMLCMLWSGSHAGFIASVASWPASSPRHTSSPLEPPHRARPRAGFHKERGGPILELAVRHVAGGLADSQEARGALRFRAGLQPGGQGKMSSGMIKDAPFFEPQPCMHVQQFGSGRAAYFGACVRAAPR